MKELYKCTLICSGRVSPSVRIVRVCGCDLCQKVLKLEKVKIHALALTFLLGGAEKNEKQIEGVWLIYGCYWLPLSSVGGVSAGLF